MSGNKKAVLGPVEAALVELWRVKAQAFRLANYEVAAEAFEACANDLEIDWKIKVTPQPVKAPEPQ
jgi:hypothetical protein